MMAVAQKNVFAQTEKLCAFVMTASHIDEIVMDALGDIPDIISLASDILLTPPRITLYADADELSPQQLQSYISAINAAFHSDLTLLESQLIQPTDWVLYAQQETPLMVIGDVVVAGSHHNPAYLPNNKKPLWLDAGAAFGTGEHATTAGCLKVFCELLRYHRPKDVLDVGCGTALLGMAAAALVPSCRVTATDNDPVAVRIAKENIFHNRLHTRMHAFTAQGFTHPRFYGMSYDVIFANILAHPIRAMAGDMSRHVCQGGYAILSGFYQRDTHLVYAQFRQRGFVLLKTMKSKDWSVLLLQKI